MTREQIAPYSAWAGAAGDSSGISTFGREPGRRNEAPPVPNYVSAADDPSAWGDAGTEDGFPEVPDTLPDDAWTDPVVEDPVEEPAEGLSLRERLARAASGPSDFVVFE